MLLPLYINNGIQKYNTMRKMLMFKHAEGTYLWSTGSMKYDMEVKSTQQRFCTGLQDNANTINKYYASGPYYKRNERLFIYFEIKITKAGR